MSLRTARAALCVRVYISQTLEGGKKRRRVVVLKSGR